MIVISNIDQLPLPQSNEEEDWESSIVRETCKLKVRVLSVSYIWDFEFEGEVLFSFIEPKFVLTLMLEDSKHDHKTQNPKVTFPVYDVVFFAVHSVSGLFGRSDVVGQVYNLRLDTSVTNDHTSYILTLSSSAD